MTDRIDFGAEPWQAIPRRVLRDPTLSHRAKGGLVTLLSHEEGWVRSCIAILQHEGRCGRKQAQAIMAELRDAGYAELIHVREGNLVKSRYLVRATPERATFQGSLTYPSDLPETGPARTGSTGKGAAVVEALDVNPLDVEPPATNLAPLRERDPIWDVFVELYGEPTAASRGAWNTAAKTLRDYGATVGGIEEFYRGAMSSGNDRFVITPTALAKHYGSRASLSHVPDKADHAAQLLREAMSE